MQIQARQFARQYDLFGCIQCGKCTGGCPMTLKTQLNIRRLIYQTLVARGSFDLLGFEVLWDCTTCSTCTMRCPKDINPMEVIIGMRSALVEGGRVPPTVKTALESVFRQGNPLSFARSDRAAWVGDLPVRRIADLGEEADFLYYVGCTPSYDPRIHPTTRALVDVFDRAGLKFGILGEEEQCCGSEVRRLGESGLFEMLSEDNLALFEELGIHRLVTVSPHCFNVFRNDYPRNGWQLEVQHYTQVVAELIESGRLTFSGELPRRVTYHDPCYLGKHNGIFDPPRAILRHIPGLELVEMERSRERSLCCEGGGGRMWLEGTNREEKLASRRVQEALETGAEILATACPFCVLTLEEAAKLAGLEERIQVREIMQLVAEVL
ncbi:MAG: (Fe-S)-binding protein [Anaerolineae bacterium]|nr:(Fe-S)-binding protein [Anaerolineae bacterium]